MYEASTPFQRHEQSRLGWRVVIWSVVLWLALLGPLSCWLHCLASEIVTHDGTAFFICHPLQSTQTRAEQSTIGTRLESPRVVYDVLPLITVVLIVMSVALSRMQPLRLLHPQRVLLVPTPPPRMSLT